MGLVRAAYTWRNNADLMVDVHRLGYIRGRVFDATPGRSGLWWDGIVADSSLTIELNKGQDFRDLQIPSYSYETVAFDPPYKLSGTPAMGDMDARYGLDRYSPMYLRKGVMQRGFYECSRILVYNGHLLAKCQDQVSSGEVRWQTDWYTEWAETIGLKKVDRFDLLGKAIPQPMDGRTQRHAHGRASSLLVFRK